MSCHYGNFLGDTSYDIIVAIRYDSWHENA